MTAVITCVAVLDIVDVLRVLPVLVEALFVEEIFRHVFCTLGIYHELAVAIFLVCISIAVCAQVWTYYKGNVGGSESATKITL